MPTEWARRQFQRPMTKDRQLLREAGEHLGTLAEQARESLELAARGPRNLQVPAYSRWAKLSRLSREILEIANGD